MSRRLGSRAASLAAAVVACALAAAPARAGFRDVRGHFSLGYAKLFVADDEENPRNTPGGSLSVTAGLEHPVNDDLSVGPGVGFHLLGSLNETSGSLFASVDFTVFEATLLAHWSPKVLGPVGRVSFGPMLMSARAELSTSGGGAAFSHLAVEEVAPGAALDVTLMSRRPRPVRIGLELGARVGFLPDEQWRLATARVAFHY